MELLFQLVMIPAHANLISCDFLTQRFVSITDLLASLRSFVNMKNIRPLPMLLTTESP